jgi:hypothetical protein
VEEAQVITVDRVAAARAAVAEEEEAALSLSFWGERTLNRLKVSE